MAPPIDVSEQELADYQAHLEALEASPDNAGKRDLLTRVVAAGRCVIAAFSKFKPISDRMEHGVAQNNVLEQQLQQIGVHNLRDVRAIMERMARLRADVAGAFADADSATKHYMQLLHGFRGLVNQLPPDCTSIYSHAHVLALLQHDSNLAPGYRALSVLLPGIGLHEAGFVREVFDMLCPRVRCLLEVALKMTDVSANVLAATTDPDIGAVSIVARSGQSDICAVLEVIRALPVVPTRPRLSAATTPFSREMDPGMVQAAHFEGRWFDIEALCEVVERALTRMETHLPPAKIGVIVSKRGVFVLFSNDRMSGVFPPFQYAGVEPHLAAAIAHSFSRAIADPSMSGITAFMDPSAPPSTTRTSNDS
ncbi:hypothetical protein H4R19_000553 [Coemansia spiralis]|nr:hypothetical protein H4R19_000553 [Coemansia spiralis]